MTTENLIKPSFKKAGSDDFYKELHREVQLRVLGNKKVQNQIVFKSIFFMALYFVFYSCILMFGNQTPLLFVYYTLTGITMILVFLNAFHDAAHGAIFKKRSHNELLTNVLELFGSNSYIWKKRHIVLHHPYPNMQHWDIDVKQSDIVRIFPESKWYNFHRYQHYYMWFLYFFYTLNWLLVRDFKDFFGVKDNYLKRVVNIPKIEYVKLFAAKIFNLFFMIGIPMMVLDQPWYKVLAAFLVMHFLASAFGVTALLSTHADEDAVFPKPPEDGQIDMTWAMYQIRETKDFSTESRIANILFGGFNHHVAHHLFPTVAHVYYPAITPIIREFAQKYQLEYRSYPLHEAIYSHFMLLKKNGGAENLFATGEL
ncbi:fatty acid desaturase family protein [Mucilaginibacter sp. KACC 22063]|uniref:fatty acid desaturase family protein n=1 Tax=Mucilaginibacter sp. KACC 22063 TaxID=3025666 RepID=UPI0023652519|nr:acyl-CoA desaturase [Mucilaginibacter sp. KACC 22063]WDF53743.1 acyl-CoA desaturase [Mucilaginibacter sp. KACC 22063]